MDLFGDPMRLNPAAVLPSLSDADEEAWQLVEPPADYEEGYDMPELDSQDQAALAAWAAQDYEQWPTAIPGGAGFTSGGDYAGAAAGTAGPDAADPSQVGSQASSAANATHTGAVAAYNAGATASKPHTGAVVNKSANPAAEQLLQGLNPAQYEAVIYQGGPLLIVAGAGSGKTRVLTHRIAYLLATGRARGSEILAITFTNKAAAEMRERLETLVGGAGKYMWVLTFHSACVRILRREHEAAGLRSSFSIYDATDSQRLITLIVRELGIDPKRFTPKAFANRISDLKNELITPLQFAETANTSNPFERHLAEVYRAYNQRLKAANALDFNYEQDTMVGSNSLISELFDNRRDPWQDASNSWVASQTPTWQDAYKDPTTQLEQNDAANQSGDPLDRRPPHAAEFVLSLGGNVGGVLAALRDAVHKLQDTPGIELTDVAPLARTAAVTRPDQEAQPDYLNTVIVGLTGLSPRELLAVCHRLEDEAGRVRTEKWGIRTLDVDIICYEGVTSDAPDLTLPHPRAHERAFVLLPWSFADSELSLDGQDTAQLADVAPDRDGVRWLALDWLETDNLPTLPTGQYIEPPYADEDSDSSEDQSQDNGQ